MAVALGVLAVALLGLDDDGVAIVGDIGIPPPPRRDLLTFRRAA